MWNGQIQALRRALVEGMRVLAKIMGVLAEA
jgi:hypothetical protein